MHIGTSQTDTPLELGRRLPLLQTKEDSTLNDDQRLLYLNNAQWRIYNFGARNTLIRAGRGFGKTSIMSLRQINTIQTIPLGTSVFLGSSIKQLYTKTMPNLIKSVEQITGLKEGIHFFRGRPPKSAGFPSPLARPRSFDNVVYFYTGHIIYLVSMEVTATANGLNLCSVMIDEARFINWLKYKEEVLPALRGDTYDHPGWNEKINPYYLSTFAVSDAAIVNKQKLWEKEADDQTDDVNRDIACMIAELELCPELAQIPKFTNRLNRLRCQSKKFWDFSSIENVEILGENYIKRMQRELPPLMFNIQILGRKRSSDRTGYYSDFDISVHGYVTSESDDTNVIHNLTDVKHKSRIDIGGMTKQVEYEAPDLDLLSKVDDCRFDTDIDPKVPLCIAFDYNKNVNALVIGQHRRMDGIDSAVILKSMYVVNERKLRALCGDFCRYYEPHRQRNNHVILYYDSTGKQGGAYALEEANETKFFNVIKSELEKRHWHVTLIEMGSPMRHDDKYRFINDCFAGKQQIIPRINQERNDYLIASLENAQIKIGRSGQILKDKSTEKLPGRSEEEQATDTDMSDAFDTLIIGMRFFGASGTQGFQAFTSLVGVPLIS